MACATDRCYELPQDANGQVAASRWSVAGLDPISVEETLPINAVTVAPQPQEWQVVSPALGMLPC